MRSNNSSALGGAARHDLPQFIEFADAEGNPIIVRAYLADALREFDDVMQGRATASRAADAMSEIREFWHARHPEPRLG